MAFTARLTTTLEIMEPDNFGAAGRTTAYRVATVKMTGATRKAEQTQILSADLSAVSVALAPMAADASVASNTLFFLLTDQPVDIRLANSGDTVLSHVQFMGAALTVSALYLTTGSLVTTVLTALTGGSGASVNATIPQS